MGSAGTVGSRPVENDPQIVPIRELHRWNDDEQSNVLIYACDHSDSHRQTIALDLIAVSRRQAL